MNIKNLFFSTLLSGLLLASPITQAYSMTQEEVQLGQQGVEAFNAGDYKRALKIWKPLVDKGNPIAQHNYAAAYATGKGVKQDYREAMKWYRKAASHGKADSMRMVGVMYYKGEGVKPNSKEAFKWFLKAAEAGDKVAQQLVGAAYSSGDGVKPNVEKANMWYKKSGANVTVIQDDIMYRQLEEMDKRRKGLK
ncbi:tetratricopeptide repeat protein [Neisseria sp.]|uniref:tetratricopeptide repeat protein n=1 Tax=Neisseria sp. TaxID=192066 RepID=UPI00359FF81C